jgi:NAD(P)-dependent dehydrogenase (short-subunit alcohol dehydrogenase family)
MNRLKDKYVVITGASGGIGKAACRMFCEEGATVVGVDLDEAGGAELQQELADAGASFEFRRLDVTSEEEVNALATDLASEWPTVDVLFNNAGRILGKHVLESTVEEWDSLHDVNAKSVFLTIRALAPHMTNPGGSIINMSSGAATLAIPSMAIYCGSKADVAMFSKAVAVDLAPGIRVNSILPGTIDTPMPHSYVSLLSEEERKQFMETVEGEHLLGRIGRPEEVAAAALFLASDESSFVTGSSMAVDGGYSAF